MASAILGRVFYAGWERRELSEDEFKFLELHERYHIMNISPMWTRSIRCREELHADIYACSRMLVEGYDIEDVLQISVDLFFMKKFGMKLKEYQEKIREVIENGECREDQRAGEERQKAKSPADD